MNSTIKFLIVMGIGLAISIGISLLLIFCGDRFFLATFPIGGFCGFISFFIWDRFFSN